MPTTLSHLFLSRLLHLTRQPTSLFPLALSFSSELPLSQSNVCVYLINAEALLITATGRYVAWMVTCWPGQELQAVLEPRWKLDRDATVAWHHPAKAISVVFSSSNHFTSLQPVCAYFLTVSTKIICRLSSLHAGWRRPNWASQWLFRKLWVTSQRLQDKADCGGRIWRLSNVSDSLQSYIFQNKSPK